MPAEPWGGLAMTEEFERALPDDENRPPRRRATRRACASRRCSGATTCSALAASATDAFDGTCPGLFTLIGDAGLGKTRLAAEAASIAGVPVPDVRVVAARALHPIHGGAAQAVRALLCVALDAPRESPGDPRQFCVERLGETLGGATWEAVAAALGWAGPRGGHLSGEARNGLMLALAEALRRGARRGPLAVILDDADQADDVLLDALEYATLDGEGTPLWVVVTARPRFEQARPSWGQRNQRHTRLTLAPLAEEAAMDLASRLLLPAEYPPAEILRGLADWAGGNPDCLRQIVRSLKRAGAVRRRAGGGSYVATAEVEALPPRRRGNGSRRRSSTIYRRSSRRAPGSARRSACRSIAPSSRRCWTAWSARAAQERWSTRATGSRPWSSGGSCCETARAAAAARTTGTRSRTRSSRRRLYEMLDPAHRAAIHRSALAYWRAQVAAGSTDGLRALARHAAVCGDRAEAADAYLALGDLASARHDAVEADQRYDAALQIAEQGDARRRVRALAGRGRSRYRMCRVQEARSDFGDALALAEALGDAQARASLLLEDATALDWAFEFEASARRVEEARPLVDAQGLARALAAPPGRRWSHLLASGEDRGGDHGAHRVRRSRRRAGRLRRARPCPEHAGVPARERRSPRGRRARLRGSDRPGHGGRRSISPLRGVRQPASGCGPGGGRCRARSATCAAPSDLAREIGNPWLEKLASYNVAVLLHWSDRQREALALLRRARWLEEQASERPMPQTAMLLAQIHLALDEYEQASQLVSWIQRSCALEPGDLAEFTLLELVLSEVGLRPAPQPSLSWGEAIQLAKDQPIAEQTLMFLYWRARMALRRGHVREAEEALASAREHRGDSPLWLSRFVELERTLEETSRTPDVRPAVSQ